MQRGGSATGLNGTFTFDDPSATATMTIVCPAPAATTSVGGYSFDGTTLVVVLGTGPFTEQTFVLQ